MKHKGINVMFIDVKHVFSHSATALPENTIPFVDNAQMLGYSSSSDVKFVKWLCSTAKCVCYAFSPVVFPLYDRYITLNYMYQSVLLTITILMFLVFRDQRVRYHEIRTKAEVDFSIISIVMDGIDQSVSNQSASSQEAEQVYCQLLAPKNSLDWCNSPWSSLRVVPGLLQYLHDPNLTINVLLQILIVKFQTPPFLPSYRWIIMAERTKTSLCGHS